MGKDVERGGLATCFSAAELADFERDGFIIVRRLADRGLVEHMTAVTRAGVERGDGPVEYEADLNYPGAPPSRTGTGGDTIRRLKEAQGRDPVFTGWMMCPAVLNRLTQIVGPRVVMPLAHHNCIMTKQPRFSSETGWHRDIRYWSFARPDLVSLWLALGDETPENGCLFVIPGTHRMEFRREQLDDALFLRSDLPENRPLIERKVPVKLAAGDALFFHCRTYHAAGRNQTDQSKYSVVFTFRDAENLPRPGTRSAAMPELLLPAGQA